MEFLIDLGLEEGLSLDEAQVAAVEVLLLEGDAQEEDLSDIDNWL